MCSTTNNEALHETSVTQLKKIVILCAALAYRPSSAFVLLHLICLGINIAYCTKLFRYNYWHDLDLFVSKKTFAHQTIKMKHRSYDVNGKSNLGYVDHENNTTPEGVFSTKQGINMFNIVSDAIYLII